MAAEIFDIREYMTDDEFSAYVNPDFSADAADVEIMEIVGETPEVDFDENAYDEWDALQAQIELDCRESARDKQSMSDADMAIRAIRASVPEPVRMTFPKYLTDNNAIVDAMADACKMRGARILVNAPAGAGKTYLFAGVLAKRIHDDYVAQAQAAGQIMHAAIDAMAAAGIQTPAETEPERKIIIAVPNNIQAHQVRAAYGAAAIAGDSNDDFDLDRNDGRAIATVYDSLHRLISGAYGPADFARMILIIDEAHQLVTEESYRNIEPVIAVADQIVAAGGTVICMTATPRQIMHLWAYDAYFKFERKDGKRTNVGKVNLVVKSQNVNFNTAIIKRIKRARDMEKIPVVRIQNKEKIAKIAELLRSEGMRVEELTSESKVRTKDDAGNWIYSSNTFRSIVMDDAIPDVDVLLTTSVLEVGTSIKGVMRDGQIVADENIYPIYVCTDNTDPDRMLQFFARFRFPIPAAEIIMNKCRENSGKKIDVTDLTAEKVQDIVDRYAVRYLSDRNRIRNAFLLNHLRRTFESLHAMQGRGRSDAHGISKDNIVMLGIVYADATERYFRAIYNQPDDADKILSFELGVPVSKEPLRNAEKVDLPDARITFSDDFVNAWERAFANPRFVNSVVRNDMRDKTIVDLISMDPQAVKAIKAVRPLLATANLDSAIRVSAETAAKAVIEMLASGADYTDPDTGRQINEETATDAVYDFIGKMKQSRAIQFMDYLAGLSEQAYALVDDGAAYAISQMHGNKYHDFLTMYTVFRRTNASARWAKFRTVCDFWANNDTDACRRYRMQYQYTRMNKIAKQGDDYYMSVALPRITRSGAEHLILSHPEEYLFCCRMDTRTNADGTTRAKKNKSKTGDRWGDKFLGMSMTAEDMQNIADGLGASIARYAKLDDFETYTAQDVFDAIQAMYNVTIIDKHGREFTCADVKDFKDGKMIVRGIRYQMHTDAIIPRNVEDAVDTVVSLSETISEADEMLGTNDEAKYNKVWWMFEHAREINKNEIKNMVEEMGVEVTYKDMRDIEMIARYGYLPDSDLGNNYYCEDILYDMLGVAGEKTGTI